MKRGFAFRFFFVPIALLLLGPAPSARSEGSWAGVARLIGKRDAVLLADPQGRILFSRNPDTLLVPASTLKLLTSLVGLHHLGADHRFPTEVYTDARGRLKIKGYGDPLLISEVVADLARAVRRRLGDIPNPRFTGIVLDGSYFEPAPIPGVTTTLNPYDAPNGALCVNFNTVNFKKRKGTYVSAEPQTPLLPFALDRVRKSGVGRGRIILSQENDDTIRYAGHLIAYFLRREGISIAGEPKLGTVRKEDSLLLRYRSPFPLTEVIRRLLEHSNNFMANQILLSAGAEAHGPPGNLDKGIRAAEAYLEAHLGGGGIRLAEGSGISRGNLVTASAMHQVLKAFKPYHELLKEDGAVLYKTGTLSGISTRAGYIRKKEALYPFVALLNTPGKSAERVVSRLAASLLVE